jgi:hypothetical protein
MATTVDTLLVRIEADLSDLRRDLRKATNQVDQSANSMKKSFNVMKVAAVGAVGVIAVRALAKAGMSAINLASDVQEMQGKSSVVFGAFRDDVVAALDEFGNQVGRATHELEGMAATLQDTFVPMGFARGEAAKLSVEMTKLAVDVGSFNNVSSPEVMRAFQSALVGNHETVRRFGVIITEATLSQELMRMGIEKGTKAATEAQKVQARMNLITNGVTDAQGDAARTSNSFANRVVALKAELSELGVLIGQELLPVATRLVEVFIKAASATSGFLYQAGLLSTTGDLINDVAEAREKLALAEESGFGGAIHAAKNSLAAAEFQLAAAQVLAKAQAEAEKNNPAIAESETPTLEGGGTPFKQSAKTEALLKENALIRARAKLIVDLMAAEKSGNREAIILANHRLDQMSSTSDVTEDMYQRELRLQEARSGGAKNVASTIVATNEQSALSYALLNETLEDLQTAMADYQAQAENGKEIALNLADENLGIKESMQDVKAALDAGLISMELYKVAMAELGQQLNEQNPIISTLNTAVQNLSSGFSDALADMVMSGKMNLDSLKDVFRSFVKVMIAKAIELFFVNKILNAIFGGFGGVPLPTASFPGLAGGGSVSPNQPYMVGERGPELFVPSSAGTVMNNSNSKGFGGGSTTVVNQTINVSAGVSQTVRAEMLSLLPSFKQETMSGVADAKRRGGSYGRAFG